MSRIYTVILADDGDEITRVSVKFVESIDRSVEGWVRLLDKNGNERGAFPVTRVIGIVDD